MSKRRSKRPSPGSQLGKPSNSDVFTPVPFIDSPPGVLNRRLRGRQTETTVDPVMQMPGVMGRPPRGRGFIPLSGGPKVKKGDRVGPPEDLIRRVNRPRTVDGDPNSPTIIPTVSPRKKGEGQPRPKQRVRGDYSNPADFVKPSDLLTPIWEQKVQPWEQRPSDRGFGPTDEPYGPIDTRPKPKPVRGGEIDVDVIGEPSSVEEGMDNSTGGVYYYDKKGRFLTRGKYYGQTSRTSQRSR